MWNAGLTLPLECLNYWHSNTSPQAHPVPPSLQLPFSLKYLYISSPPIHLLFPSPLSNSLLLSKCTCVLTSIVKALWTRAKITSVNNLTFYISLVIYRPYKYEVSHSRNANSKMTIVRISASQPSIQYLFRTTCHTLF